MQSENGILLLFYIFLSHGNGKKMKKGGVGCKKGGMLCAVHKHLWSSDHFLGTLKILHTVSVSSSDSLVIGFRCMFYK